MVTGSTENSFISGVESLKSQNGALFAFNILEDLSKMHRFEGFPAENKGVFRTTGGCDRIFFSDYGYPLVSWLL